MGFGLPTKDRRKLLKPSLCGSRGRSEIGLGCVIFRHQPGGFAEPILICIHDDGFHAQCQAEPSLRTSGSSTDSAVEEVVYVHDMFLIGVDPMKPHAFVTHIGQTGNE